MADITNLSPEDRTKYAMRALGWQGGTVHQLCSAIGCEVQNFLYYEISEHDVQDCMGWFAARTCGRDALIKRLLPKNLGNVPFWIGVAKGEKSKDFYPVLGAEAPCSES